MISVKEAILTVESKIVSTQEFSTLKAGKALGYVLFQDVVSPISMPPFRQSAMDGYAICLTDDHFYQIIDEIKAGDGHQPQLKAGEAVRIFTGAPVPDTANAIVIQEKATIENHRLTPTTPPAIHDNIRPMGEQVLQGQVALKKGTVLTTAGIAFLTSLGITEITVFNKPSIAIVVTGNELAQAGTPLKYGQIYESNALMLETALRQLGYAHISHFKVDDNYDNTKQMLQRALANHDLMIVSGGISVGDYDFVGKALYALGVKELFYKVKQKPGKPLFFGQLDEKFVFALPGNPAAALSCFYIYVYPALQRMSGHPKFALPKTLAKSNSKYLKKGDRSQFLKAIYHQGRVEILDGQNSSMLHTFALANALVYLPESGHSIEIDDTVEVILLPIQ